MKLFKRKLFALGALCAVSAGAQSISVGVIGGAPFRDVVNATTQNANSQNAISFISKSTNFTVGPAFQVNLPLGLRVEIDALYRPYSFLTTASIANVGTVNSITGNQWRFPVLAQYRFSAPLIKPFVEAGASFDHLSNLSAAAENITSGPGTLLHQTNAGVVLGGGVDVKIPFIRLSGELRYTHQGSAAFQGISNQNQAEVLLGIHF
jgi:hypothetical protein